MRASERQNVTWGFTVFKRQEQRCKSLSGFRKWSRTESLGKGPPCSSLIPEDSFIPSLWSPVLGAKTHRQLRLSPLIFKEFISCWYLKGCLSIKRLIWMSADLQHIYLPMFSKSYSNLAFREHCPPKSALLLLVNGKYGKKKNREVAERSIQLPIQEISVAHSR